MSDTSLEQFSREDLIRIGMRDRRVKEQLAARVGALLHENIELTMVIQEQGEIIEALRLGQATLNGDVPSGEPPLDVASS